MTRNKLYLFILFFAISGYSWVTLSHFVFMKRKSSFNICLFRSITGVRCPSCGTTHSVLSIIKGDFKKAAGENILGYPLALMLLIFPFWVLGDVILRKGSFYQFYCQAEILLRKKWIAWSCLIFILLNWGWVILRHR